MAANTGKVAGIRYGKTTKMENLITPDSSSSIDRARRKAFVEHFSIERLYGSKTVSLNSKFAATVLIARNGSGKTTLIAALDAFLRTQFTRFIDLDFESITCKLRGVDEPLVLKRQHIQRLAELATSPDISTRTKAWETTPASLLSLLEEDFSRISISELRDHPAFNAIYQKTGYISSAAKSHCETLAKFVAESIPEIHELKQKIRSALGETKIVYLPTYRRIELSLPSQDTSRGERRANILSKLGVSKTGLHAADIQFGLSDISDRLRAMHSEMLYYSNQGYGKISAGIISDLINHDFSLTNNSQQNWPTKEALRIFFSRIRDADRESRRNSFGPFNNFLSFPDLDRVYSGEIPEGSKAFLSYFLDQLNKVILTTKGTEDLVETFISSCNRYLSGDDGLPSGEIQNILDSKKLKFNRKNLAVKVFSMATKKPVSLEALSSGEKQMISLFARLYLYPDEKIILIDEPELSLSINWQRKIIPDILNAPSCKQVIAITHSPFVFDNALEPFASSLNVSIEQPRSEDLFDADDFEDQDDDEVEDGNRD